MTKEQLEKLIDKMREVEFASNYRDDDYYAGFEDALEGCIEVLETEFAFQETF